jgi:purine nucleoside permease
VGRDWALILSLLGFVVVFQDVSANENSTETTQSSQAKIIKAVVVTMFEHGEPRGDRPGEMQFWVERYPFTRELSFDAGVRPIWTDDEGVLLICTGAGTANATASIMALGLDERFDLSQAVWLIAGIAGGDPLDVSLGSAVWARHVVDGDLAYEIDAREIPETWPYGLIPLGATEPVLPGGSIGQGWSVDTVSFALNESLVNWAHQATKDVPLLQSESAQTLAALYEGFPRAQEVPQVRMGETLASSTYWHGARLNEWANDWVQVQSDTEKNFMTTNMEDSGTMAAIRRLDHIGRADIDRVLVLRTVSNFTMPPPGRAAAWSATSPYPDAGAQALEAAYRVGRKALDELLKIWPDVP